MTMFKQLDQLWGPYSIDRFASSYNAKLSRFNSRFLQPGTEAVRMPLLKIGLQRIIGWFRLLV